jgi:hypothetical protein
MFSLCCRPIKVPHFSAINRADLQQRPKAGVKLTLSKVGDSSRSVKAGSLDLSGKKGNAETAGT